MRPAEWMQKVLQRHGINVPDGRPLYQYRLNENEFVELLDLLKLSARLGINNITEMLYWDAVFVMYASEWWRRHYEGKWGWDGVFYSIDLDAKELSASHRNALVKSGLQRWRREVRSVDGARKFLGTIATEGGLPLKQLHGSGGWLNHVLQPALRKHLTRGISIDVLIENSEELIPPTYRSPELMHILTDITHTVVALREKHDLKDKEEPLEWLDANYVNWRELFPFPMDDSQAKSLLSDLIDTASKAKVTEASAAPFEVERMLVRAESECPDLVANIDVPSFVYLDKIGLGPDKPELPSMMTLEIYVPGGKSWPWSRGVLTTYRNRNAIKLSGRPLRLRGEDALNELRLRFKHLGETFHDMSILGGTYLDTELPWMFRLVDAKWQLQGIASQSIKSNTAMVVIPKFSSFEKGDEDTEVTRCGEIFDGELLKLSGVIHCHLADAKYELSAGIKEKTISYDLGGKKCGYSSSPKDLYIGKPELVEENLISGHRRRVKHSQLQAKRVGVSDDWKPLNQVRPGYYEIRLADKNGNLSLRRRVVILSEDFDVEILPDRQKVNDGEVHLHGTEGFELDVSSDAFSAEIFAADGKTGIRLQSKNEPPISFEVSLLPDRQSKVISLNIPYPSKGALLFDPNGEPAVFSKPLQLSTLNGYRVKLFDDKYRPGQKVNLVFTLFDRYMNEVRDIYVEKQIVLSGELTEFSIQDWYQQIDSLISVGASLDSMVQITMSLRGQTAFELSIYRYESELSRVGECVGFELTALQRIGIDRLSQVKISALNLAQPEQNFENLDPQRTQGMMIGSWQFKPDSRQKGPWIIYPSVDSSIQFRPLLWNVGSGLEIANINNLTKAMLVSDPEARACHIRSVMKEMANDLEHRSWDYLANLWKKTKHLPLTTFDLWRLSINEPSFLASLLIKDKSGIVERLETELPVIWELVKISDWVKSFSLYRQGLVSRLDDEELADELLSKKISDLEIKSPSLISIGKILRLRLLGKSCQELMALRSVPVEAFLAPQLKEEYQNLLRRQANNDWPEVLSGYLYQHNQRLPNIYTRLIPTNHSFQVAVTNLPWVLAWISLSSEPSEWPTLPSEIFKIQQLIRFDEDWFTAAFQYLSAWLSQQDMESL